MITSRQLPSTGAPSPERRRLIGLAAVCAAALVSAPPVVARDAETGALHDFLLTLLQSPDGRVRVEKARLAYDAARASANRRTPPVSDLLVSIAAAGVIARAAPVTDPAGKAMALGAKSQVAAARRAAPQLAWVHAADGLWHLGVVSKAGPLGAGILGASARTGFAAIDRALLLDGDDPFIALSVAAVLTSLDPVRYGARATVLAGRADTSSAPPPVRNTAAGLRLALQGPPSAARAFASEII